MTGKLSRFTSKVLGWHLSTIITLELLTHLYSSIPSNSIGTVFKLRRICISLMWINQILGILKCFLLSLYKFCIHVKFLYKNTSFHFKFFVLGIYTLLYNLSFLRINSNFLNLYWFTSSIYAIAFATFSENFIASFRHLLVLYVCYL